MVIPSNRSGGLPQSQTSPSQWRAFLLESLCGILTLTWYLFALAEGSSFRGLTRLTKFAEAFSDDPSRGGGEFGVLIDEAESSFEPRYDRTHASGYELESARLDQSQDAHPRPGSRYHISWILILASLTGLNLQHCESHADAVLQLYLQPHKSREGPAGKPNNIVPPPAVPFVGSRESNSIESVDSNDLASRQ